MRTKGTPAELEARRLRAAELLGQGKRTSEVARLVGVTSSWLGKWKKTLQARGGEGLKAKPIPGRKPRLNGSQKRRLVAMLKKGAAAAGYDSDLWTCRRVRDLIRRTFDVRYDFNHVGRILHALGFSVQKPEPRARERDEQAIARWRMDAWPRLKKNARRLNATVVFYDESGFMLRPLVRQTWAPRGVTPIIRCWDRRDRLSVIGGIIVPPSRERHRLSAVFRIHTRNIRTPQATEFLRSRDRHVRGPLIVVQDRLNVHRAAIRRGLAGRSKDAPRVMVEWLPPYAPDLDPSELL